MPVAELGQRPPFCRYSRGSRLTRPAHLVWEEKPLFSERIEAWANGPVIRELYNQHRGEFVVGALPAGDVNKLAPSDRSTIDAVIGYYGEFSAHQLSELTHSEAPWKHARQCLPAGSRSSVQISDASMFEYYDSLTSAQTN